uniref:ATP synthase F0 subunit 8 n=1 Tax=Potamilus alatus TaxID=81573 RepID=A0A1P8AJ51_9BIVA|nr:ATP synthase F0 subunit 8 [Potamilus alatus]AMZ00196.1 ATP synthase F0 subunit 8 [Potamilus alatus]
MPQLSPISWVLVSLFVLVMVISVGIKVWWSGGVMVYEVTVPLKMGKALNSRSFMWGLGSF